MNPRRLAVATTLALLVMTSPAYAAAGPSPTPLILELVLAAVVVAGLAIRGPAERLVQTARRRLTIPGARRAAARARAR